MEPFLEPEALIPDKTLFSAEHPELPWLFLFAIRCFGQYLRSPFGVYRLLAEVSFKQDRMKFDEVREKLGNFMLRLSGSEGWTMEPNDIMVLAWYDDITSHQTNLLARSVPRDCYRRPVLHINPLFLDYLRDFERHGEWESIEARLESVTDTEIAEIRGSKIGDSFLNLFQGGPSHHLSADLFDQLQPPLSRFVLACQAVTECVVTLAENFSKAFGMAHCDIFFPELDPLVERLFEVPGLRGLYNTEPALYFTAGVGSFQLDDDEGRAQLATSLRRKWETCGFLIPDWFDLLRGQFRSKDFCPRATFPERVSLSPNQSILFGSATADLECVVSGEVPLNSVPVVVFSRFCTVTTKAKSGRVTVATAGSAGSTDYSLRLVNFQHSDQAVGVTRFIVSCGLRIASSVPGRWIEAPWSRGNIPCHSTHVALKVCIVASDYFQFCSDEELVLLEAQVPQKKERVVYETKLLFSCLFFKLLFFVCFLTVLLVCFLTVLPFQFFPLENACPGETVAVL